MSPGRAVPEDGVQDPHPDIPSRRHLEQCPQVTQGLRECTRQRLTCYRNLLGTIGGVEQFRHQKTLIKIKTF